MLWLICSAGLFLALAYVFEIARNLRNWQQLPGYEPVPDFRISTRISVVIPARNEARNIGACLQSLLNQSYPPGEMEVIVVDDFSTDGTPDLVLQCKDPRVRLLELRNFMSEERGNAFKKKALETGIAAASGTLIATTDADCVLPECWLSMFAAEYQENQAVFIAGPVGFCEEQNLLERFQSLDYLGMMILTGAAIRRGQANLSNGANLAYPKAVFEAVGGFSGIDHLASGDDMLLLQKITKQYPPDHIRFVKNAGALVRTRAKSTLPEFLSQRLRWASKSAAFRSPDLLWTLSVVFLLCWAIILSPVFALVFGTGFLYAGLLLFAFKSAADYALLSTACRHFGRRDLLRSFWPSQLLHIAYIAFIGVASMFRKRYSWKGRSVK